MPNYKPIHLITEEDIKYLQNYVKILTDSLSGTNRTKRKSSEAIISQIKETQQFLKRFEYGA